MENFVIILKKEHTDICMLKPAITVKAAKCQSGNVSVEITGSADMGDAVFFSLTSGTYQGRYIEDYDEDTQERILDSIETFIARDIAQFATMGYTYVGIDVAQGEDPSECFFLEDHKAKWQKDYRCLLELFHQGKVQ